MKGKHATTAERNTQLVVLVAIAALLLVTLCFNKIVIDLASELAAIQEKYDELIEEVEILKTDISEPIVKTVCLGSSPETITESEDIEEKPIDFPELDEYHEEVAIYLAKTVWGEARGCSKTQQAGVVWTVLNRADCDLNYIPDDLISIITQKHQFVGYRASNPVDEDIYNLCVDVLERWLAEKEGAEDVGRVLAPEYLYFHANSSGTENIFTDEWRGGNIWDWSLESPYDDVDQP